MSEKIGELLARRAAETPVGRREELDALFELMAKRRPLAIWLHGIAGIGKSTILQAFVAGARDRGTVVIAVDCRAVEPTEAGLLAALGLLLGEPLRDARDAGERISAMGDSVVLVLDHYEAFRLVDTWLRLRLLPALGDHVQLLIASREAPPPAWVAGTCADFFATRRVGALNTADSISLLRQSGVDATTAVRLVAWTQGHPLALRLAAAAAGSFHTVPSEQAIANVLLELTRLYLDEVPDPDTRCALEAMAAVRRATRPLLAALCPNVSAGDLYERVAMLNFVEPYGDGLALHEVVRDAIASVMHAADAPRLRRYRQIAWQHLRDGLRTIQPSELWRWTADVIFLIENPVVREAFFPTSAASYAVEPARHGDANELLDMVARFDPGQPLEWMKAWWEAVPTAFHVIRDARGGMAGFYCMATSALVDPEWVRRDPLAWRWWQHLQEAPRAQRRSALFLRRWLSKEQGEAPGAVQAVAWLDIKRSYLELRPGLRRVYLALRDPRPYAAVARELGFRMIEDAEINVEGGPFHTAMLDFGPGSVDGWICDLVGRELGMTLEGPLDTLARQMVVEGRRVDLTPLEFGTLQMLQLRSGQAVSRDALLDEVWGRSHAGGSNVVDSVIRSLRRKLGGHAPEIETVHGVGYRYRPQPAPRPGAASE